MKNSFSIEMYESLPSDVRAEIFEGHIQYMTSPTEMHQTILSEILVVLVSYVKSKKLPYKVLPAPFDVKLNDNPLTLVQPDIIVICDKDKLDGKRCNGAPDFIVEIVSSENQSNDYFLKTSCYEQYGVREYWIVDPQSKLVTVHYFENNQIEMQHSFDGEIKINIFNDLIINLSEFLE